MQELATVCKTPVLTASRDTTVASAARMMREAHVGALVVVDKPARTARAAVSVAPRPIGIVTDRDIVMAIVALDLEPKVFLLDDMLTRPLITASGAQSIAAGLALMNTNGIRRLPLVNPAGELTGMVALDDLIIEVARDLQQVAGVIEREIVSEIELRPSRIRARKAAVKRAAAPRRGPKKPGANKPVAHRAGAAKPSAAGRPS